MQQRPPLPPPNSAFESGRAMKPRAAQRERWAALRHMNERTAVRGGPLGYECLRFVASEKATHVVLRRQA